MAYGLLLYKQVDTPAGTQRLEIYKDGYTGSAIEVVGLLRDGLSIGKDSDSITQAVTTSVLTIRLRDCEEVDFSQFFTPNSTLFKVIWKTKAGSSWETRWTGFITPDSFTENLAYKDTITLTARDNMGRLDDYDFDLTQGQLVSVRSLLTTALSRAGVAMGLTFATTKVATVPATILAVDGLVNTTLLQGMTWRAAIEMLLTGLGMILAWNDGNSLELRDISQAPSADQAALFIERSGYRQIRPAWKNLTIEQDYGLRDNFYEGQFSIADTGGAATTSVDTFTPPSGHRWVMTGNLPLLNPYSGIEEPSESIFPLIGGDDDINNAITYSQHIAETRRSITIGMSISNCYWKWGIRRGVMWDIKPFPDSHQSADHIDGYTLRFRFNVFLTYGGTKYVLRNQWQVYDPSTIDLPYISFLMPWTREGTSMEDVSIEIGSIPADGLLEFVIYKPLIYLFNGDDIPVTPASDCFGRIANISFTIGDASTGRKKLVAINSQHNIQNTISLQMGQVPPLLAGPLHFLGGLFYTNDAHHPLEAFARVTGGSTYDLLELVGREYISYQNDNYNALSGEMMASTALRFDKAILFDTMRYRIVCASLDILGNILSANLLQQEAEFDTEDYTIETVDNEGGSSIHTGTSSIGQSSGGRADTSEIEAIFSTGLAKAFARISSLEDWLRQPSLDEMLVGFVGTRTLDLGGYILEVINGDMTLGFGLKDVGDIVPQTTAQKNIGSTDHWWNNLYVKRIYFTADTYLEYDGDNAAVKLNGNTYATGFITAFGTGSGGSGGGGLDLGLMWSSLANMSIPTADVTPTTKISVEHIPDIPHTKVNGLGQAATMSIGDVASADGGLVTGGAVYSAIQAAISDQPDTLSLASGIASVTARVSSLEDWLRGPAFDEVAVAMLNVADMNFGRLLRNDELEHNKVTIAGLEVALGGTISLTDLEGVLGTTPLVGGLATVSARVASLEDWLRNPAMDDAYIADLGAGAGRFSRYVEMYDTLTVAGLISGSAGLKLVGTTKKIWFGDAAYIELDANGYLHTNIGFYSDNFITAFGSGSGGSGGGIDLGAVWTSLRNQPTTTAQVTDTMKIAQAHIPLATTTTTGIVSIGTGLNVSAAGSVTLASSGVTPGTYTSVTVDQFGRVTAGTDAEGGGVDASITGGIASNAARITSLEDWLRDPALDELAVGTLNARSLNLGTKIANDFLEHDGVTIANTLVHLGGEMSKDQLRSLLEINNVENTKLSTWAGTTNITVLGTVATGVWHGTAIANDYIANPRVRINGTWVYLGDSYSTASISGGTAGSSSDTSGVSFAIPYLTVTSYGLISGFGTRTHSISGAQIVSAIGNNYVNNARYATSAGNATNATYATYDEDQYRFRVYYAGSLVVDSGLKLKSRNGSTLSTISSTDLVSAIGNSAVNRATGDESGNRILTGYGATLSAASNALKLLSMSGATLSTITAANLVTVLGTTPVNRATADANGNNIASSYLSTAGGTIAGDLRLQSGNYGQHLYFGDGAFCYIHEDTDDHMMLYGDKGITLSTRSGYGVTVTYDMTVNGKLYITSNAYLEYSSSNAGIHFSKGLYSDYYITAFSASSSSDSRLKMNQEPVSLTVSQIAAAPAITFDWIEEWRGKGAGSIAQYWQPILPQNVKRWDGDFLSMEYGNIALLSAITIARAVESHEQKITRLENRVKDLERKLSIN